MIKVFLVEDEKIIRKSIKNNVKWPIPPYPHILFCSCAAAPGTIVIIPDTKEMSRLNFKIIRQIFAAKLVHSG